MPRGHYERKPRQPCLVDGCNRARFGRGYCNAHYKRWRKYGDPGPARIKGDGSLCVVIDCTREARGQGLCASHHRRWLNSGQWPTTPLRSKEFRGIVGPCLRPNCNGTSHGSGYCVRHQKRMSLLISYGLAGWEEFDELWKQCDGRCQICLTELDPDDRHTNVDHDHDSGKVRGLLCGTCNRGLGLFYDSPRLLDSAAAYLRERVSTTLIAASNILG